MWLYISILLSFIIAVPPLFFLCHVFIWKKNHVSCKIFHILDFAGSIPVVMFQIDSHTCTSSTLSRGLSAYIWKTCMKLTLKPAFILWRSSILGDTNWLRIFTPISVKKTFSIHFPHILLWKISSIQKSWRNFAENGHIPTAWVLELFYWACCVLYLFVLPSLDRSIQVRFRVNDRH